jgi:uncharacterized repeat protein (TIGR03843 family)
VAAICTAIDLEHPVTLPEARVHEVLAQGVFDVEHGLVAWGSNYTFLVTLTLESTSMLAIYKPRLGEQPLWDFAQGTLNQREVAAWMVAQALNWRLVPPTVLREGPRGIGSLQVFIDHNPEEHYFRLPEALDEDAIITQLQRMALFDILANNADRKGGHCLFDPDGHLWGIDHGLTFHTDYKLRTVIWDFAGQPIPAAMQGDIAGMLARLHDEADPLRTHLAAYLTAAEIAALEARARRLEARGVFTRPGRGMNVPWPRV